MRTPGAGQRVELRLPAGLGRSPVTRNPASFLEAVESRIEGALLHSQHVVRDLLDALRNGPAVLRLVLDGPQDQQVEGALDEIGRFCPSVMP